MLIGTVKNFQTEVIDYSGKVLVDFWADWCGPCQAAGPVLEKLATEYAGKVKFGKLDVDKSPQSAGKFNVMSIPTVILFDKGEEKGRLVGFPGEEGYKKLIDSLPI